MNLYRAGGFFLIFFFYLFIFSFLVFQQECPSGVVNEETFKQIYAQFFPHGGKQSTLRLLGLLKHALTFITASWLQNYFRLICARNVN